MPGFAGPKTALVVGSNGIVGGAVADLLLEEGWQVVGLNRRPARRPDLTSVEADLGDAKALAVALHGVAPALVVLATWSRQASEAQNITVNGAMVRNVLDVLRSARSVRHVALVTGLKHYFGPFEAYLDGAAFATPLREEQGRVDAPNFYYAQEDEVFAAAARDGMAWSVHRPHTILGRAVGNAMNLGNTLAVYGSICRDTGRPFAFPGSAVQWECLSDFTDARLLARHVLWAATTPAAANEAFNVVNGDLIRWKWLWPRLAAWFEVEAIPFGGDVRPMQAQMAGDAPAWASIAQRQKLVEADIDNLASPWHTDADLGRPFEVVTDMTKSRLLGFDAYQSTERAFRSLFADLRRDRLIP